MGNAKSLPVVGEVVTTVESGIKITAAGACALVGENKAADELAEGAGKAWVEYSEKNFIVGTGRAIYHQLDGNGAEADRVITSTYRALGSTIDAVPGLGHVKGVGHYIVGDKEGGHQSMIAASRSTAVLGAGLVTGGLGAGAVVGGFVGVGGGVAYDGVHSALDKEENHGVWNIAKDAEKCKTGNDIVDFELGFVSSIVGDFLAGSASAEAGKNLMKAKNVNKLKNELKSELKNVPNIDPDIALDDTIDAAKNLKKNIDNGVVKGDGHVSSKVRNLETNETGQGVSARARCDINVNEFETKGPEGSGFESKSQARKAAKAPSKFMQDHPEVKPEGRFKPQSCAEHAAMDSLPTASSPSVLQMVSVKFLNGVYQTILRCKNCLAYAEAMGTVATDFIREGMAVPTKSVSACVTSSCKCGAFAVGSAIVLDKLEINRNLNSEKKI